MNLSNKFSQIGILRAKRKVRENGKRNCNETTSMLTEAYIRDNAQQNMAIELIL